MPHPSRLLLLAVLAAALIAALPAPLATSAGPSQPDAPARFVVFETFMQSNPADPNSSAAALAVNQLIQEYAARPVALIEYDMFRAPFFRQERFAEAWRAQGSGTPPYPWAMTDSGFDVSAATGDYLAVYRSMLEAALAQPAGAEISGVTRHVTDTVQFRLTIINRAAQPLGPGNAATVHGIVFEATRVRLTDSFSRLAGFQRLAAPLAPDAAASYAFSAMPTATSTRGYAWNKMSAVAIVDYRPAGGPVGPYRALQAARLPSPLEPAPFHVTFLSDPVRPAPAPVALGFRGAPYASWTATTDVPWLTLSQAAGASTDVLSASVQPGQLTDGWQNGTVFFRALDAQRNEWSSWVTVSAYRGPTVVTFMPLVTK